MSFFNAVFALKTMMLKFERRACFHVSGFEEKATDVPGKHNGFLSYFPFRPAQFLFNLSTKTADNCK
jgi:hypothetical protein